MNVQATVRAPAELTGPGHIENQLVAAVERSEVRPKPFDHVVLSEVLDPALYAELLAAMPERSFYHELRHQDALRKDGTSTRLRLYLFPELLTKLPTEQRRMWTAIARALASPRLEAAF